MKITNKKKNKLKSPTALDDLLYNFMRERMSVDGGISAAQVIRRGLKELQGNPDMDYPGHNNPKPHRAPAFLVDLETADILEVLCAGKSRNTVIRNALWSLYQSINPTPIIQDDKEQKTNGSNDASNSSTAD